MNTMQTLARRLQELTTFDVILSCTVAFLALQLVRFIFIRKQQHQTFKRMGIPGPEPNFFSGHLYETRRQAYVKFAHRMHEKFGKTVGYFMGGDPFMMTKDLELIQQVFVSKSRIFYDRMHFYLNVDPVPDNLICQRGDRWRYMRKLLTPAFSHSRVRTNQFYQDSEQTVRKLISQLDANKSLNSGETFVEDLYDRMAAVALDVIVKTAFHMDNVISFKGPVSALSPASQREAVEKPFILGKESRNRQTQVAATCGPFHEDTFLSTVKRACKLAFNPLVELIFCFPTLDKPLTFLCNQVYFSSIIKLLFDRLDYLVRQPRMVPASSRVTSERKKGHPNVAVANERDASRHQRNQRIIDGLLEVLRDRKITMSEFRGNAFVIVFAGFETTANALTFTLWLLAKHQSVQDKLRKEIWEQLGEGRLSEALENGKETTLTSLSSQIVAQPASKQEQLDAELNALISGCEYLEMVINESLRLYPPVPTLSCRQASRNCTLSNGQHIEKGVNILPSVFSIHRDQSIWGEDAGEFRPERFQMLHVNQLNSAMFMPFGLGPRNCIGKALAMHEMKIVIGRLIQHYSVHFCSSITPKKLKLCSPINITITNSEPISLRFIPTSSK